MLFDSSNKCNIKKSLHYDHTNFSIVNILYFDEHPYMFSDQSSSKIISFNTAKANDNKTAFIDKTIYGGRKITIY